jgi:hypothetical protein
LLRGWAKSTTTPFHHTPSRSIQQPAGEITVDWPSCKDLFVMVNIADRRPYDEAWGRKSLRTDRPSGVMAQSRTNSNSQPAYERRKHDIEVIWLRRSPKLSMQQAALKPGLAFWRRRSVWFLIRTFPCPLEEPAPHPKHGFLFSLRCRAVGALVGRPDSEDAFNSGVGESVCRRDGSRRVGGSVSYRSSKPSAVL